MSDLKPIAPYEWNLRSIEKTITIDDAPEPTRKPAPVVVVPEPSDARKGRLRSAGVDNDRLIASIAAGPAVCQPMPGFEGSRIAVDAVSAFLAEPDAATLVLAGLNGRGKSYAAVYPLAHSSTWDHRSHRGGQFLHASRVYVGRRWDAKRDACIDATVLVIDDLGRESGEWAIDQVLSLILDRHDNCRKTIITTNMRRSSQKATAEQIAQHRNQFMDLRYNDALMSRLSDPTATRFVVCKGDDIRPTHTQENDR